MARRPKRAQGPLPPPLPPETRTVGQLVAEAIRLYGGNFLRALPLGVVVAVLNQVTVHAEREVVGAVFLLGAPLFAAGYAYASQIALRTRAPLRSWVAAIVAGSLVFFPAALLFPWFALASVL